MRLGLAAGVVILGAAVVLFRPTRDVGYVEIKTVPVASLTQTALYIDSAKLAPIKQGSAILQERVGTLRLQADGLAGSLDAAVRYRGEKKPHHHRDHLRAGASATVPMPLQRFRRRARVRELVRCEPIPGAGDRIT